MSEYTPAFPKIGPKKKAAKIMNRKARIHNITRPSELVCTNCLTEDQTCRIAHVEDDYIKFILGEGGIMGSKVEDDLTGLHCATCCEIMDFKPGKNTTEAEKLGHSMKWAISIIRHLKTRLNETSK